MYRSAIWCSPWSPPWSPRPAPSWCGWHGGPDTPRWSTCWDPEIEEGIVRRRRAEANSEGITHDAENKANWERTGCNKASSPRLATFDAEQDSSYPVYITHSLHSVWRYKMTGFTCPAESDREEPWINGAVLTSRGEGWMRGGIEGGGEGRRDNVCSVHSPAVMWQRSRHLTFALCARFPLGPTHPSHGT